MICKKCGAEIKSTLKFCNKCGAKVTTEKTITEQEKVTNIISEPVNTSSEVQATNNVQAKSTNNIPMTSETMQLTDIEKIENYSHSINDSTKQTKIAENSPSINNNNAKNKEQTQVKMETKPIKPKSKKVAGWLAIFLGFFGIQWFYLEKPIRAIIYIAIYIVFPFIWLLYIAEGIFFLCAKQETFDNYRIKFK